MSAKEGGHGDQGEEKSFGKKVVDILVNILIGVVFLQVISPLIGFGGDGVVAFVAILGSIAHNLNIAATASQREILLMLQRFLQIAFALATFALFGMILRFAFTKIAAALNPEKPKAEEKHADAKPKDDKKDAKPADGKHEEKH